MNYQELAVIRQEYTDPANVVKINEKIMHFLPPFHPFSFI